MNLTREQIEEMVIAPASGDTVIISALDFKNLKTTALNSIPRKFKEGQSQPERSGTYFVHIETGVESESGWVVTDFYARKPEEWTAMGVTKFLPIPEAGEVK